METDGTMDDLWTDVFLGKLYMNMCTGYQRIGYADHAIKYAQRYFALYPPHSIEEVSDTPVSGQHLKTENTQPATSAKKLSAHNNIDAAILHRHLGCLYEVVDDNDQSLKEHRMSLGCATLAGSVLDAAMAHGHIGATQCRIAHNDSTFTAGVKSHERHISMCEELGDRRGVAIAAEMLGDSYAKNGNQEKAEEAYNKMLSADERHTLLSATAQYKIGGTHLARGQRMRAAYYYDAAENAIGSRNPERKGRSRESERVSAFSTLSNKSGKQSRPTVRSVSVKEKMGALEHPYARALIEIHYGLACSLRSSSEFSDLERARKLFEQLIVQVEDQICQFMHETAYFPRGLMEKLKICYEGAIDIQFRTSGVTDALVLAENLKVFLRNLHLRKFPFPARFEQQGQLITHREEATRDASQLREKLRSRAKPRTPGRALTSQADSRPANTLGTATKAGGMEDIVSIVNQQGTTVVYFGVTEEGLYVWVLQPCGGLVKSYSRKAEKGNSGVKAELHSLIGDLHAPFVDGGNGKMWYVSEKRDAPPPTSAGNDQEAMASSSSDMRAASCDMQETHSKGGSTELFKSLYTRLLGPTDDILHSLPSGSPLIFIPDSSLALFPFHQLRDWRGQTLESAYRLTVLPSLSALADCTTSELADLASNDAFEQANVKHRLGGLVAVGNCQPAVGASESRNILTLTEPGVRQSTTNVKTGRSSAYMSNPKLRSALKRTGDKGSCAENLTSEGNRVYQQLDPSSGPDSVASTKKSAEGAGTFYTQVAGDSKQNNHGSQDTGRGSQKEKQPQRATSQRQPTGQMSSALTATSSYRRFTAQHAGSDPLHASGAVGAARKTADLLRLRNCTTLTSRTSTGTDILTSTTSVPEYQQLSRQESCAVIGNPEIPERYTETLYLQH